MPAPAQVPPPIQSAAKTAAATSHQLDACDDQSHLAKQDHSRRLALQFEKNPRAAWHQPMNPAQRGYFEAKACRIPSSKVSDEAMFQTMRRWRSTTQTMGIYSAPSAAKVSSAP